MQQGQPMYGLSQFARLGHFLKRNRTIFVTGAMLEAALLIVLLATQTNKWTWIPSLFFVPFGIYLASIFWMSRLSRTDSDRTSCILIVVFSILFRLTLLFSGPVFSLDMFRYYWDGKVAANGINPYLYSPDSPQLSSLRDSNWELINHKYLRTGYPPLMELFFELLYILFHSVQMYKVSFFVFDIATILAILLVLRQLGMSQKNLIIYAWAPLPIIEISQTGHNDSMAVFLMILSFLFLLRGRNYMSSTLMGLSVVSKLFPIFFVPVLFRRWGIKGILIFFGVVAAFHVPFLEIGPQIYYGLLYAINTSFFNGSVFPFVTSVLTSAAIFSNPGFAAQLVIYSAYSILLLYAIVLSYRDDANSIRLMKICFLLVGALLLLNRSFFPWYIAWTLPFVVFYRSRAWLLLSGSIFLGYMKYDSFPPPPYEGVSPQAALLIDLVQYVPFYALFAYEVIKKTIVPRISTGL